MINVEELDKNESKNCYFCPKIFEIICKYLHLLPLWTGIYIQKWFDKYPQFEPQTRLTNNSGENHFGHTKKNTLNNLKVMPSEFIGLSYSRLNAKFIEFYQKRAKNELSKLLTNEDTPTEQIPKKKKKLAEDDFRQCESCYKNKKNKRQKGIFYQNISDFASEGKIFEKGSKGKLSEKLFFQIMLKARIFLTSVFFMVS